MSVHVSHDAQQGSRVTTVLTFLETATSLSPSPSPSDTWPVTSRMIFFSAAFKFVASPERRRPNLLFHDPCSVSASWSNSRSCDAILGPVMTNAAGILPWLGLSCQIAHEGKRVVPTERLTHLSLLASLTKAPTCFSVALLDSRRICCGQGS